MDKKSALGQAIRYLRGRESQTKVARRAGIKNSTWSDYENGKQYPTKNKEKVARGLQCSPDHLEEIERKFRSGELTLDNSYEDLLQRLLLRELEKIPDPVDRSIWVDLAAGFDRLRSAAFKMFTRASAEETVD